MYDNFGNIDSFPFKTFIDKSLFGFMKVFLNNNFHIEYMNDYLLSSLEYTREEISIMHNNELLNIIDNDNFNIIYDNISTQILIDNTFETNICFITKSHNKILFSAKGLFNIEDDKHYLYVMLTNESKVINQIDSLERRANHDSLTGLFNRGTSQTMIEKYIANFDNQTNAAMVLLDIDNFKTINDTYGHLVGDSLLIDLSDSINKIAYKSSINGRYGGDEFIVFLKDIPYNEFARGQIQKILDLTTNATKNHLKADSITFSAGISFFPDDALSFDTLLKIADSALYQAKHQGKNNIVTSDELDSERIIDKAMDTHEHIENTKSETGNQLIEYSFNLLSSSKDIKSAIKLLFAIIGRQFDICRINIFENDDKEKYIKNTFEWSSKGMDTEYINLQELPYDLFKKHFCSKLIDNSVFAISNISELDEPIRKAFEKQNIKSSLQCPLKDDDGNIYGFLAFIDCMTNRKWNNYQIAVLQEITNIVNVFLIKEKLKIQILEYKSKLGDKNENN